MMIEIVNAFMDGAQQGVKDSADNDALPVEIQEVAQPIFNHASEWKTEREHIYRAIALLVFCTILTVLVEKIVALANSVVVSGSMFAFL